MGQSPWEANRFSASQKFPTFYGTRKFITAFTCPCTEPDQSSPCPIPKSHFPFQLLMLYRRISPDPRQMYPFRQKASYYREELLAPRPNPKMEDHPLSAVRDCLVNLFAATLRTGGRSSTCNLRKRRAVVTGTHFPLLGLYFVWQMSFVISTAIPPPVRLVGWVGYDNKISEQKESGKRYPSGNIMIICRL